MKYRLYAVLTVMVFAAGCTYDFGYGPNDPDTTDVIFLHHSTGGCIFGGGVPEWFDSYNADHGTSYSITDQAFPKSSPYGWNNYPYDYWNIWVNHAGQTGYKEEPTLEVLTKSFDIIIWKHCYPVSGIQARTGNPDIASQDKTVENYKLQYNALKAKMREFPQTRFIVWTGAALTAANTSEAEALRAREFFTWVREEWDTAGDNIFIWDFYELETERGLYLLDRHAVSSSDSHPNDTFSAAVAPLFCSRIVNVAEGRGDNTSLTGK